MSEDASAEHRLRVMTWNLWWRFGPRWRDRQPGIVTTLRTVDPDVVALQEVWGVDGRSQADVLADALGFSGAFAAPSLPPTPDPPQSVDHTGVALGVGLLSRWPILSVRQVPLPARHRTPPVSLVALLDHPAGPLPVVATCLEWEPAFNDDRLAQARALAELGTDPELDGDLPVVVAGDLNAAPTSPVLQVLTEVLTDAWLAGGGSPTAVTLDSAHPQAPLEAEELIDQRIDHVLVRPGRPGQPVTVSAARLAGDPIGGLDPSDHRAVVCDLTWPGQRAAG